MKKKYAVIGNPIDHSLSPVIHQQFAKQFQMDLSYERILAPLSELKKQLTIFQQEGGLGVNVTLPFKQEAWSLAPEKTARAEQAKAVNTLLFRDVDDWLGDNSDGIGLFRDLTINYQVSLKNKNILIVGAGGATRGIIPDLLLGNPQNIIITNRTAEKAIALAHDFNVRACDFNELHGRSFDLVINATSAGTKKEIPVWPELSCEASICYDLAYGAGAQSFLSWANQRGAQRCIDGLGMLVEQAAESFWLWHHQRPETQSVIQLLRENKK